MADRITVRRLLSLLSISAKIDLSWLLRDTRFALTCIVADILSNAATMSSVFLIAVRFSGIGGMSADEVLLMLAYSSLVTGIFTIFGASNNIHISRIIGRGQLEHFFIQPVSLPVQLLTQGFMPFTAGANLIVGAALMAIAVQRLGLPVTLSWLASLVGYLAATMVIIAARAYLVSTLAFYAPVACEEISSTAIEGTWTLSTFPLSGMPRFVQVSLLTVLPEGLMAWYPALCLLGRPPLSFGAWYPAIYATLLSLIAMALFRRGLRYYMQKGANRYVSHGFRR